ncbi:MAG: hypothetical protein JST16_11255 [Bdellovibrionales bacterium]|nr:hypothetical protein [Bdellovibrionales bacterium]
MFIKKYLDSIEQLEILLLLYRTPTTEWTLERLSQEMRTSQTSARNRLNSLVSAGLVVVVHNEGEPAFRYVDTNEQLHYQVSLLEQEYKIRRMRVIDCIYAPPAEKMLTFKDAFKIRKTDSND